MSTIARTGVADPVVAEVLGPALEPFFGGRGARLVFWDGSSIGPARAPTALVLRSPDAVRRLLWMPNELGMARAFVAGELDVDGDIIEGLEVLKDLAPRSLRFGLAHLPPVIAAARRLGVAGRPPDVPAEEAHVSGWLHSKERDTQAVTHHYDVGNDFYRLVLGPSMTYSCARFVTDSSSLEDAQAAKYELICRKLGLHERPPARLLDVGCGWGSMAMHAATHHGAQVLGITLSEPQADLARQRVADAGIGGQVEIRVQDYRDLAGERFDVISSIGMSEHVGAKNLDRYFATLYGLLGDRGRLLNHAISSTGGSRIGRYSFIGRYVFPDGELIDVGDSITSMERAGFEVRDVESLREHYARTLRHWVQNLTSNWSRAVELVGERRARVWLLYMAASSVGFTDGGVAIHQVLGVRPDGSGASGMPATRGTWG
jgi:cyclopropane-fatty-acyl-phospholipid synthase